MKKLSFLSFVCITVLSFSILLSSCSNDTSEEVDPQTEVVVEEELNKVEQGIFDFFDFCEPNDVLYIFHTPEGLDWDVDTWYQFESIAGGGYNFRTKNRIKFAQWADKQLKAGKCVKARYDKETGYYYGYIVRC